MTRPLTERVLDRLPGPRLAWMLAWASLGSAAYLLTHVASPTATYPGDAFLLVFAVVNFVGLWANAAIGRRVDGLQPRLADMLEPGQASEAFRSVGSTIGPLAFALVATLVYEIADFVANPNLAQGLRVVPVFFGQLAGAAFIWVYVAVLVSLIRIGGRPLRLPSFESDPGLGLRPFGQIAFIGFVGVALSIAGFMATTGGDPRTGFSGLLVMFALGGLFFVSLYRLHLQMVTARSGYLAWARDLYAQALAPLRASPTVEVLERQAARITAATEIERRVKEIAEWPFDDWVLRTLVAILLGATAGVAARAVATGIGI